MSGRPNVTFERRLERPAINSTKQRGQPNSVLVRTPSWKAVAERDALRLRLILLRVNRSGIFSQMSFFSGC